MNTHEEDVLKAVESLIDHYANHRTEEYFECFAEDATFVFYTESDRLESRAAYRTLWAKWEAEHGFHVHACVSKNRRVQVMGETAVFLHDVETRVTMDGETHTPLERETIVVELRDGRWLGVHEHLSAKP